MDKRFYHLTGPVSLADLIRAAGLEQHSLSENSGSVSRVAVCSKADYRDLAFSEKQVQQNQAGLLFAPAGSRGEGLVVETDSPRLAYARAAVLLGRPREFEPSCQYVDASAQIEEGVKIAPGAVIGAEAQIGADSLIGAGAVIGPGVCVGRKCQIGANVSLGFALIGDRVLIQAGAAIGEAGFGMVPEAGGLLNIPHFGRVVIQEGAVIGANSCVARGVLEDTHIGPGARIDNLCQIGHNVSVGANAILVGACGISGSVKIGDGALLAGAVGIADHINIGAGAKIAARSGVGRDIPAGQKWGGYPARPFSQWARENAWIARQIRRKNK